MVLTTAPFRYRETAYAPETGVERAKLPFASVVSVDTLPDGAVIRTWQFWQGRPLTVVDIVVVLPAVRLAGPLSWASGGGWAGGCVDVFEG
jgi:hypothetical protein